MGYILLVVLWVASFYYYMSNAYADGINGGSVSGDVSVYIEDFIMCTDDTCINSDGDVATWLQIVDGIWVYQRPLK